jgi:hypothetical protein
MSIFDDRQYLHGLPKPGQKVKYIKPTKFAFHSNVIEDEKNLLELGKEYTVHKVNLNSSSTYVILEEFYVQGLDEYRNNQKCFNMHAFEWELPEINLEQLIGDNPNDLSVLNRTYNIGITKNGKVWYPGERMLCIEHEILTEGQWPKITKAYWKNETEADA